MGKTTITERWLSIKRTEGKYEVSSHGFIRHTRSRNITGTLNRDGYIRTTLYDKEGKRFNVMHHQEVAQAFLGERNGLTVNHIDGDKLNNRISNLEYISQADNNRHRSATIKPQNKHIYRALTKDQVTEIKQDKVHNNGELARKFNVTRYVVRDVRIGRTYTHI